MEPLTIETKIRAFIDSEVLEGQGADLAFDTPLLDLGILDSFSLFLVLKFILDEFGVQLALETLGAEQFQTIHSIAAAVRERLPSS
jgi:acyl carrier protein